MIKVYTWDYVGKDDAWGHASMHVNLRYISWWPQEKGGNLYKSSQVLSKVAHKVDQSANNLYKLSPVLSKVAHKVAHKVDQSANSLYSVLPIANRAFNDDIYYEGNRQPNNTIIINGLDETKIIFWWNHFAMSYGGTNEQGPIYSSWSTLDMNCSTVVATALKEGGGDKYSDFWKAHNCIWRPDDVKRFAESIATGLKNKKSP